MRFLFGRRPLKTVPSFQPMVPAEVEKDLGLYVYALCDPATGRPFYVGQGRRSRPNQHFTEAVEADRGERALSDKLEVILDIWRAGEAVEIVFLRRGIKDEETLDDVEAAVIDALNLGAAEALTNQLSGNDVEARGFLSLDAACGRFAPPVDPGPYDAVFLLNIARSRARGLSVYDAARGDWSFGEKQRAWNAVAVAVERGVGVACFGIDDWQPRNGKWAFVGDEIEAPDLVGVSYRRILERHPFWQRNGGRLIVSFDGEGNYLPLWGEKEPEWTPLAPPPPKKQRRFWWG
ncbi:GIY-YIG nuclease family protein [Parvularcula lutaonensis]|uniref:GIY-YIG domain-containing protein n=1 Tax=Parvularcula lutaonensis TaxID=491923 RepID=A0ABV7M7X8_9PROT|nr:GIY-YIG nuclease family protein [Parvularcula lutaonensis]GGY43304.1 hypothetical protein GCM10007148_10030 [Parvularcula lutaonensis]